MNQEEWNSQGADYRRQTNGTGGDMPTGFRPCPFCHSVIPWDAETCPSCGRVLIERVATSRSPTQAQKVASGSPSWWTRTVGPRLAHANAVIRSAMTGDRFTARPASVRGSWSTTTRGTSWSVFQPAGHPSHSWWPRSLPRPTDRERTTLLVTTVAMVILFLAALIGVKR